MNLELERLISLQRVESDLRRVQAEVARLPQQKTELTAGLAQEKNRLETARQAVAASQKARRDLEARIQDLETKRSKYKGQLMEVKTNKEYTAVLHEIEAVERDIRAIEDLVLVEMERADALAAGLAKEEQAYAETAARHRSETQDLEARGRSLDAEVERLRLARDAVAATLSEDALVLFQRVAKLRGTAVAEAKDGTCQECHVKLRLQMYADLKRNEELMQCPACNRVLYFEAPVPDAVVDPPA